MFTLLVSSAGRHSMKTPLYDAHLRSGAKMIDFAGWEMPLQYAGIAHEVGVVRDKVGLFDVSHMGEFVVSGPNALSLVQYVTTNDVNALPVGKAQYTLMCDENGGPIDDLIVYRTGLEEYLLVVNASNERADFQWLLLHNAFGADIENQSAKTALIAIQGPVAERVIEDLSQFYVKSLGRFHVARSRVAGIECKIARTGYTGEDGFEILCASSDAVELWRALMEAGSSFGIEPIGLGARDVLRLEAAYPLYGHELTREMTPVAARLMWVVKPEKGEFIGREAIVRADEAGPTRILVGMETLERCIPRHESNVLIDEEVVGRVTSGTFSPTLGRGIALAYVDVQYAAVGTELQIDTGGRICACRVVQTPFYKR